MPAKPAWYSKIDRAIEEVRALPRPFVDRSTVEVLLAVGRRRAQQILGPCVTDSVGRNGLAGREAFIDRLRQLADGDDHRYEVQRRKKLAATLGGQPRLLVEAPARVVNQEFANLPPGVQLEAGRITVEFDDPRQALEKLLALAMAISNDFATFEATVATVAK